ncbi:prepilin peptidase [Neobacillus sp. OS1-33]|uniref:A24 family peptidase n=1 Tax=Neobacillus sp. OS1-33 TaxID=3070683 RepID=UPI0027E1B1DA|nr:prepilin peptidase [Neobacillus sp. OS1-33]WML24992.1 prepilin peptidase [Neobacillus sp. OS1-33]
MEKIILVIVLVICLFTDIKSRKILNIITLPTIVFGLLYNIFNIGVEGVLFSGKGFLIGLGLLIIPYLLGGMGAGDVKLMAAIGALMGTSFVFYSFIYTALIGGVIALLLIIKTQGLKTSIKSLFFNVVFLSSNLGSMILPNGEKNSSISFPYGVAIVLGTLSCLVWGGF